MFYINKFETVRCTINTIEHGLTSIIHFVCCVEHGRKCNPPPSIPIATSLFFFLKDFFLLKNYSSTLFSYVSLSFFIFALLIYNQLGQTHSSVLF